MWQSLKKGRAYMELWPEEHKVLFAIYQEVRVKRMMKLLFRLVPPAIALLIFWIYYTCGGYRGLYYLFFNPHAASMYLYLSITSLIVVVFVLLLLPIHGLMWFYSRSIEPLNAKQRQLYLSLMSKIERTPNNNATMYDLAEAMQENLRKGNKSFLEEL